MKRIKKIIEILLIFVTLQMTIQISQSNASFFQDVIRLFTNSIQVKDASDNYTLDSIKKYYYNQLNNDIARRTYDALSASTSDTITINLEDLNLNTTETGDNLRNWFENNCSKYLNDGIQAYTEDSGNYWWQTKQHKWQGSFKNSTINSNSSILKEVTLTIKDNTDVKYNNQAAFNNKLTEACNNISGNTVYEKVVAINKYICDNVAYGYIEDSNMYRTAYGALVENKALSEGYAQLFNLMCRKCGIISICVYGTTTNEQGTSAKAAWNYVYEPNKKEWYAVDCAWNEEVNDFLMVGSDTIVNGMESLRNFGYNHTPSGYKAYDNQTFSPTVPTLAKERYTDDTIPDEPNVPDVPDTPEKPNNILSSSVYQIENSTIKNIQPNTSYEDFIKNITCDREYTIKEENTVITGTNKIKTGQILTVEDKNYILVITGDTNGDGEADIKDILQINKHRLNKAKLTNEYLTAGDVNEDGEVDIKDILQINKYRLGKISNL